MKRQKLWNWRNKGLETRCLGGLQTLSHSPPLKSIEEACVRYTSRINNVNGDLIASRGKDRRPKRENAEDERKKKLRSPAAAGRSTTTLS